MELEQSLSNTRPSADDFSFSYFPPRARFTVKAFRERHMSLPRAPKPTLHIRGLAPDNRCQEMFKLQTRVWTVQMSANQRLRLNSAGRLSDSAQSGIQDEQVLSFVFDSIKWNIHALCAVASVNRKLRAIAKRVLWRQLCVHRAPRMLAVLTGGDPNARMDGGWHALAKLMFFCCGCDSTRNFQLSRPSAGHFVKESRFSKTSGRSFLTKECRGDLLYVSDPCEHQIEEREDDLGIYRGVFRGFIRSRTRECLIRRQVGLEERVRCPYCGARVWSMTSARLVPKSAARRLGSHDGGLEFFVCVNGHLHGSCWLVPLSSDEDDKDTSGDDKDEDSDNFDGDD